MKVIVTKSYEESCEVVGRMMIDQVKTKPASKLGLATGGTAEPIYPHLVKAYEDGEISFAEVHTVNLDEYVGIAPDHEQSYRYYMDGLLFDKINIDKANTYVAVGDNPVEEEIETFNEKLYDGKPLDFQLLGVGANGHIGFNEPGDHLIAGVHVEKLNESTIEANSRFFESAEEVPREAMTMGVGDILKAKKIALIATGESKVEVMKKLLDDDEIATGVPVTMLKTHPDTTIVIDQELADNIGYKS